MGLSRVVAEYVDIVNSGFAGRYRKKKTRFR